MNLLFKAITSHMSSITTYEEQLFRGAFLLRYVSTMNRVRELTNNFSYFHESSAVSFNIKPHPRCFPYVSYVFPAVSRGMENIWWDTESDSSPAVEE